MKAAFINQPWDIVQPPVRRASVPIWTYEVSTRLARSMEVTVYSKRHADQPPTQHHEGVRYRRVHSTLDAFSMKYLDRLWKGCRFRRPLFSRMTYHLGYIVQVARHCRDENYDVIHLHNLSQFLPVLRHYCPDSKLVLHMHCEWLNQLDRRLIGPRLEYANAIVGCSEYIARQAADAFPSHADKCHGIHGGVDISRYAPREKTRSPQPRILFVGRISPEKGLHVLLEAFWEALRAVPELHLDIVGPNSQIPLEFLGSATPRVRSLAAYYFRNADYYQFLRQCIPPQRSHQITFHDHLPHDELGTLYQRATVVVMPSVWDEPFGLCLAEAMASGLPVVASRCGGIGEVVQHKQTGLLVEPNDPQSLAQALLTLLTSPSTCESMGHAGRLRAEQLFSWSAISQNLTRLYDQMAERRTSALPSAGGKD